MQDAPSCLPDTRQEHGIEELCQGEEGHEEKLERDAGEWRGLLSPHPPGQEQAGARRVHPEIQVEVQVYSLRSKKRGLEHLRPGI